MTSFSLKLLIDCPSRLRPPLPMTHVRVIGRGGMEHEGKLDPPCYSRGVRRSAGRGGGATGDARRRRTVANAQARDAADGLEDGRPRGAERDRAATAAAAAAAGAPSVTAGSASRGARSRTTRVGARR